jgi:hypothetical protein
MALRIAKMRQVAVTCSPSQSRDGKILSKRAVTVVTPIPSNANKGYSDYSIEGVG